MAVSRLPGYGTDCYPMGHVTPLGAIGVSDIRARFAPYWSVLLLFLYFFIANMPNCPKLKDSTPAGPLPQGMLTSVGFLFFRGGVG